MAAFSAGSFRLPWRQGEGRIGASLGRCLGANSRAHLRVTTVTGVEKSSAAGPLRAPKSPGKRFFVEVKWSINPLILNGYFQSTLDADRRSAARGALDTQSDHQTSRTLVNQRGQLKGRGLLILRDVRARASGCAAKGQSGRGPAGGTGSAG